MAAGRRKRGFWGLFSGRLRPKRAGPALRRLGFEACEDRRLLAVGVGFAAGTLKLTGTSGAEQVLVLGRKSYVDIYVDGHVQSRFSNANAAKVSTIDFDGRGGGDSLTVQGIAGTGAGPGYAIKLTDVDTLSVVKGTNVRVGSNVALNLDTTSLWGTLDFDQSINGPFALTQTGPVVVNGTTTFDVGAAGDVTLTDPANNFSTVVVRSAGNVALQDASAIVFGESAVSGNLAVEANLGPAIRLAISQSGKLTVGGHTTLRVGPASSILLNHRSGTPLNPDNALVGTVSVAEAANATISNRLATHLGASHVTGNLSIRAAGAIDQVGGGAMVVEKLATIDAFTANASPLPATSYDVTLDDLGNRFGTLSVPHAGNLTIDYAHALNLGNWRIAGDLTLTAGGAITDTGQVTVLGNTTIATGDNITLDSTGSTYGSRIDKRLSLAGHDVYVRNGARTLLGLCSATGDLTVVAAGALTNSPDNGGTIYTLTVAGTGTLYAGSHPLVLYTDGSTFGTLVTVGSPVEINPP